MDPFKKRTIRYCLTLVFLSLAWSKLYAQGTADPFEKQIDAIFSNYSSTTPGVAVAVVKDGRIVFKKGYGMANLEYDVPITTKTVFQIASVSKQFTAFATYLLEKQGKISLEDDVRKYIPELPDTGKTVKIKHLLAHTSGVRDQAALLALAGRRSEDVSTTSQILRLLSRQKELNFEPGSQFLYSNSGYTLLAEIIKRASGQSFAAFARKNIFEPLGMSDTQIHDDFERIIKNNADSYELENGVYKKKHLNNSVEGPANLYTTVEDMAKWVANYDNPIAGDQELIKRFNEPSLLNNGERVVWGISDGDPGYHAKGQIHWNYRGLRLMSHGGHAAAFRSFLGRFPDKRVGIIALSNDEHYLNFVTSIKIADIYLKADLRPEKPATPTSTPAKTAEKPDNNLKDHEGRYYNDELETYYLAKVEGGKLILSHTRNGDFELTETGKDKFSVRIGFVAEVEFVRDGSGKVTGFKVSNFGARNIRFDKTGK